MAAEPIDVGLEDWMSDRAQHDELAAYCRRLAMVRREEDVRLALKIVRPLVDELESRLSDDDEAASLPSG